MSKLTTLKKSGKSSIGAPAQHGQATRKGKKAWRKNVDIEDVEEGLESLRAEERVSGKTLQETKDDELFVVDTTGDERVRKSLPPRFSTSQLTSAKILAQRSAVPAVFSRATSTNASDRERKRKMSREEKDKLLRIAKRPRKGPFNSILDPGDYEAGSGVVELSKAVKESGGYDPWVAANESDGEEQLGVPKPKQVKVPPTRKLRDEIALPPVLEPHQGTSYNPPVDAHHELILQALKSEEKKLEQAEKMAEIKAKMEKAVPGEYDGGQGAPGMRIDEVEAEVEEAEVDLAVVKPQIVRRKTKSQRNKETKLLAEKRLLAEKAMTKRLLASISLAKGLRRSTARQMAESELEQARRKLARRDRLRRRGLAGQQLGRHKVPEQPIEVQLGEDLSESLRGLKPEGNLFRDRFLSLQQRALIEPRVPVIPKKHKKRMIEYEKHAWKKFE